MDSVVFYMLLINSAVALVAVLIFFAELRFQRNMEKKLTAAIEEVRKELEDPKTYDKIAAAVGETVKLKLRAWWANKFGQASRVEKDALGQLGDMPLGLRLLQAKKEDRMALIVGYVAEKAAAQQAQAQLKEEAEGVPEKFDMTQAPTPEEYAKAYQEGLDQQAREKDIPPPLS